MAGVGKLGINPDAFGVWEPADAEKVTWQQFLDGAADAGFELVELGPTGYMPLDPAELSDALEARGLGLTCGYVGAPFHDADGRAAALDQLRQIAGPTNAAGAGYVLYLAATGRDNNGRIALNEDEWREMIKGVCEAARITREEYGMEPIYHPHIGFAVETSEETERFVDETADVITICLDTGQFAFPGGDPAAFIRKYGASVVTYMHLRDLDLGIRDKAVGEIWDFPTTCEAGVFCEPGEGAIDFGDVSAALSETGFDGPIIVERSLLGASLDDGNAAAARASKFYRAAGLG